MLFDQITEEMKVTHFKNNEIDSLLTCRINDPFDNVRRASFEREVVLDIIKK
jgi:hypothetical protein